MEAIQVEGDLYGERSSGEAAVATDTEVGVGSCRGEVGHGPEDSAEVPAGSAPAERDATKAYVANTADPFADSWEEIRPLLVAENHNSDLAALEVLLMSEVLVGSNQYFKTSGFSRIRVSIFT